MSFSRVVAEGLRSRRSSRRKPLNKRVANPGPWRKVLWIGIDREGKQGGHTWMLVLECGHLAIRPLVQPAEHRIFRKLPGAPKKCRCLSCSLGREKSSPQGWIDILIRGGKEP